MNNDLLFYVDTNWLGKGGVIEYTVVKLHLDSGDAMYRARVKERTHLECSQQLHRWILKDKPNQVIFERSGIAAASKDSYIKYLEQHSGEVLMDQKGRLFYNSAFINN